jgi:phosphosulfolactate synthase
MEQRKKGLKSLKIAEAPAKPRRSRWTIPSDLSIPLREQEDLLQVMLDIIDRSKFTDHVGLIARLDPNLIIKKNQLYREKGVPTFPGGIPFEIAYLQNKVKSYFQGLFELGFSGVEISEDTIPPIPIKNRMEMIKTAKRIGLEVFTEVGKKFPDAPLVLQEAVDGIKRDIDAGATKVAIENADIVLWKEKAPGNLVKIAELAGIDNIIFEVGPIGWPGLGGWLLREVGSEINVENIDMDQVIRFELMRRGVERSVGYSFLTEKMGKL